ncbi:hypothetical protein [Laspinema olomoucense]|uniref:Uncharacterized protein n=1 Tax=Laspinema olomoucense D3b TaxID=2953688 RepID=A0ABT2NAV9_9CYAN|nr:hypothetical protein [Laspinema sp. D3b]MCT7979833.1 hypothetical protein [Laspinema sp. D3b]
MILFFSIQKTTTIKTQTKLICEGRAMERAYLYSWAEISFQENAIALAGKICDRCLYCKLRNNLRRNNKYNPMRCRFN